MASCDLLKEISLFLAEHCPQLTRHRQDLRAQSTILDSHSFVQSDRLSLLAPRSLYRD